MDYNYHTHTYRCGHAKGTPEEYIVRAINGGIKHMGFSDHASYIFPDGYEGGFRVPRAQTEEYVRDIRALREKYKDKIDIMIGFEMEYYPSHFEEMLKTALDAGGEYLILGQHFIGEEHPFGKYIFRATSEEKDMVEYASLVCTAVRSGYFSYVAHPDIINFTGDAKVYERELRRICEASIECSVPLEINFLGIRTSRHYPCKEAWRVIGETGAPVTFGFDAHDPDAAADLTSQKKAMALVKEYRLNYIGRPEIKRIGK